jgi:Aegerolysin
MPARSVQCLLINATPIPLTLITSSQILEGGKWSDGEMPPATVTDTSPGRWASQSHGFFTGTEGRVSYNIGDTGKQIHMHWDNPYSGSDKFDAQADPPYKMQLMPSNGNDAVVTYIFLSCKWMILERFAGWSACANCVN